MAVGREVVRILWRSRFEALLRRGISAWQAKEGDCAGKVTAPHEPRGSAVPSQASNPESAELSRYFRDERGGVHVLL
jgi:hypothetical protein